MFKAIDKWLPGYIGSCVRRERRTGGAREIFFCLADHFEPFRGGVSSAAARDTVRRWLDAYRSALADVRDENGRCPRHTFFFPAEDYDRECLELLAEFCAEGFGEVEIHLHHRDDTPDGLAAKLADFRDRLRGEHGLLGSHPSGEAAYAFIHGNWALCNSRPDGDWCGVNEEIAVLRQTGCYADFTFPSAPSPTQPRIVNSIYRARDRVGRPRGYDRGVPLSVSDDPSLDGLVMVQGALALNWRRRKWGILPRIENSEISGANPPTRERVDLCARQQVHVRGKPDRVFVKMHTHGCLPATSPVLTGPGGRAFHESLAPAGSSGNALCVRYVSAREMYNLVVAAEAGADASHTAAMRHEILPPPRLPDLNRDATV